jgi:hypothetical protein
LVQQAIKPFTHDQANFPAFLFTSLVLTWYREKLHHPGHFAEIVKVRKKYNNFANLKLDESRVAPQNAFW